MLLNYLIVRKSNVLSVRVIPLVQIQHKSLLLNMFPCQKVRCSKVIRNLNVNLMLGAPKTNNAMKTDSSKKKTEDKSLCQSDFPFQQIRFTCKHSGKPRIRGQGKRPVQAYLPCEWRMFLRLKLDHNEMHYKITKLDTTHNHTTSVGEFKHYSRARRLGENEKVSIQTLVDLNVDAKKTLKLL